MPRKRRQYGWTKEGERRRRYGWYVDVETGGKICEVRFGKRINGPRIASKYPRNRQRMMRHFTRYGRAMAAGITSPRAPWWLLSDVPDHMRDMRYCQRVANLDVSILTRGSKHGAI